MYLVYLKQAQIYFASSPLPPTLALALSTAASQLALTTPIHTDHTTKVHEDISPASDQSRGH